MMNLENKIGEYDMEQEKAYAYIVARYGYNVIVLGSDQKAIFWIYDDETEEDVHVERY